MGSWSGGGGGAPLSTATPKALGAAAPGSTAEASDAGHIHPDNIDTTDLPGALGAAATGTKGLASDSGHVHPSVMLAPVNRIFINTPASGTAYVIDANSDRIVIVSYTLNPTATAAANVNLNISLGGNGSAIDTISAPAASPAGVEAAITVPVPRGADLSWTANNSTVNSFAAF